MSSLEITPELLELARDISELAIEGAYNRPLTSDERALIINLTGRIESAANPDYSGFDEHLKEIK